MNYNQKNDKKEISYLVLNRGVINLFEEYLPTLIRNADKVILIGDANITAPGLIKVEDNWRSSTSLVGGYSFSGSSDGFKVDNEYFVLTSPYIIRISPDTLKLKVTKFHENIDLVRNEVVKSLEEEVVY